MKKILFVLFSINAAFSQSVLLTPSNTQSVNTTKKGNNQLSINSLRSINNDFQLYNPGNSKLILSGDLFFDNFEGLSSSSMQSIEFNNLNTNRWTVRDYNFINSIEPEFNVDAFQIINRFNTFTSTAFHINKSNNFIGLGTDKPLAYLHVRAGGSSVTPVLNTTLFLENFNDNFIHLATRNTKSTGILFSRQINNATSVGGIIHDATDNLLFQTNNTVRMKINATGNIGIGNPNPNAKLDINGTTKIGSNGTLLNHIIKVSVNRNIPSIAAADQQLVTFSVTNAALNSSVYISPATALPAGVIIAHARVSVAGTVEVAFYNAKTTAIDPAAMDFHITVVN